MFYIVRTKDGRRWKVKEAVSLKAACTAISHAIVTGSIGHTDMRTNYVENKPFDEWPRFIVASVHQINSDGTERQPYTTAY